VNLYSDTTPTNAPPFCPGFGRQILSKSYDLGGR
jgi:hypothetical protein